MNSQQQTWYRAGGDVIARAGFSLAMCGAFAGVLYMTAHDDSDTIAASAGSTLGTATVVASFEASPGLYKSQAAVDASPVDMPVRAKLPLPVERLAAAAPARHAVLPIKRPARQPVAVAANVARFESCLPGCESRDPLIVGQTEKAPDPGVSPSPSDELLERVSFNEQNPSILGRAMHAPVFVYRQGRNALTTLVRAAL